MELCGFQEELSEGQSKSSIFSDYMSSIGAFIWNIHSPQSSKSYQRNSGNRWEMKGPKTTKQSAQPLTFTSTTTLPLAPQTSLSPSFALPCRGSNACIITSLEQLSFLNNSSKTLCDFLLVPFKSLHMLYLEGWQAHLGSQIATYWDQWVSFIP